MTSNNLEAIKRLNEFKKYWYSKTPAAQKDLDSVIDLLQADEDIEVKKKGDYEFVSTGHELDGSPTIVFRCACGREHTMDAMTHEVYRTVTSPKPTKETKLRELKIQVSNTLASPVSNDELIRIVHVLLNILLEEEY